MVLARIALRLRAETLVKRITARGGMLLELIALEGRGEILYGLA